MAENQQIQTERERAIQAIRDGGSAYIKIDGAIVHVTNLAEVPSEADMAMGDPEQEKLALDSIQAQMDLLKEQAAKLQKVQSQIEQSQSDKSTKGNKSA